jgi:AraC family transcriptional regulator
MSQTEKELSYKAFLNREYGFRHSPFEKEFEFYECVKKGDVDGVERVMTPLGGSGAGILSNDPLRNLRYHFIVTIALITVSALRAEWKWRRLILSAICIF